MSNRVLLGMLTPSSNTILEPMVYAILTDLPDVTVHFSRFKVTQVSLHNNALEQFNYKSIIRAAKLLADARVKVITWNGTSGGWLGVNFDYQLCSQITNITHIPATTAVLALQDIFLKTRVKKFGLVSPYLHEVQEKIIENFFREGFTCISEQHLNDRGNFSYSEVSSDKIKAMIRIVAKAQPDAIIIFCTNLKGAGIVECLESELNIPIYDSIAAAVWKSLLLAKVDPRRVSGWGKLFQEVH